MCKSAKQHKNMMDHFFFLRSLFFFFCTWQQAIYFPFFGSRGQHCGHKKRFRIKYIRITFIWLYVTLNFINEIRLSWETDICKISKMIFCKKKNYLINHHIVHTGLIFCGILYLFFSWNLVVFPLIHHGSNKWYIFAHNVKTDLL